MRAVSERGPAPAAPAGPEVFANHNAPPAVTYSAIIYSLRCMLHSDIPLNQASHARAARRAAAATRATVLAPTRLLQRAPASLALPSTCLRRRARPAPVPLPSPNLHCQRPSAACLGPFPSAGLPSAHPRAHPARQHPQPQRHSGRCGRQRPHLAACDGRGAARLQRRRRLAGAPGHGLPAARRAAHAQKGGLIARQRKGRGSMIRVRVGWAAC
jgi:hypothetical protein